MDFTQEAQTNENIYDNWEFRKIQPKTSIHEMIAGYPAVDPNETEMDWGNPVGDEEWMKQKNEEPTPNAETISAIEEVSEMKKNPLNSKSYADVDEMMKEL